MIRIPLLLAGLVGLVLLTGCRQESLPLSPRAEANSASTEAAAPEYISRHYDSAIPQAVGIDNIQVEATASGWRVSADVINYSRVELPGADLRAVAALDSGATFVTVRRALFNPPLAEQQSSSWVVEIEGEGVDPSKVTPAVSVHVDHWVSPEDLISTWKPLDPSEDIEPVVVEGPVFLDLPPSAVSQTAGE